MTTIREGLKQQTSAIMAAQRRGQLLWGGVLLLIVILPLHFIALLFTRRYSWVLAVVVGVAVLVLSIPCFLQMRLRCPVCKTPLKQYGEDVHFCLYCGANFDEPS